MRDLRILKKGEVATVMILLSLAVAILGAFVGSRLTTQSSSVRTSALAQVAYSHIESASVVAGTVSRTQALVRINFCTDQITSGTFIATYYVTGDNVATDSEISKVTFNDATKDSTGNPCYEKTITARFANVTDAVYCSANGIPLYPKVYFNRDVNTFGLHNGSGIVYAKGADCNAAVPTTGPGTPTLTPTLTPAASPSPDPNCTQIEYDGTNQLKKPGYQARNLNVPGEVQWKLNGQPMVDKDKCTAAVSPIGDGITEYYCGPNGRTWVQKNCADSIDPNSKKCLTDSNGRGYCNASVLPTVTPEVTYTPIPTPSPVATNTPTPSPTVAVSAQAPHFLDSDNNPKAPPNADNPAIIGFNPDLKFVARDDNNKSILYTIQISTDPALATANTTTYTQDPNSSEAGWSGQDSDNAKAYASGTIATFHVPDTLIYGKTYYWRVGAKWFTNTADTNYSPIWHFRTTANQPPNAPTVVKPEAGTPTYLTTQPVFEFTTTDPEKDKVRYKIVICDDTAMSKNCKGPIVQPLPTEDQKSWSAGTSGGENDIQYRAVVADGLAENSTYYLQAYAIDVGGDITKDWSNASVVRGFTLGSATTYNFTGTITLASSITPPTTTTANRYLHLDFCKATYDGTTGQISYTTPCAAKALEVTGATVTYKFESLKAGDLYGVGLRPTFYDQAGVASTPITGGVIIPDSAQCKYYDIATKRCLARIIDSVGNMTQNFTIDKLATVTLPTPVADKRSIVFLMNFVYPPALEKKLKVDVTAMQSTGNGYTDEKQPVLTTTEISSTNPSFSGSFPFDPADSHAYYLRVRVYSQTTDTTGATTYSLITAEPAFTVGTCEKVGDGTAVVENPTGTAQGYCISTKGSAKVVYDQIIVPSSSRPPPGLLEGDAAAKAAAYDLNSDGVISILDFSLARTKWCFKGATGGCALNISKVITLIGYKLKK